MLVQPVALVGALDAAAPPGQCRDTAAPVGRGVPVIVHVVVVEDHRGRDDGEEPANLGVAPGLQVQRAVLLEVGDFPEWRGTDWRGTDRRGTDWRGTDWRGTDRRGGSRAGDGRLRAGGAAAF